jgi:hypothetical protein
VSGRDNAETRFTLTQHARDQIEDREISIEWVARTLLNPVRIEMDRADPELRHALARVPEHDNRVLRVVYNQTTTPPRIVTVYFDRGQRNRL